MMKPETALAESVVKAIGALYGTSVDAASVQLQKTKKEFEGHLTLVVFPFLKISHKKPEDTAQQIGEWLVANEPAIARFNVVKGFLNLVISPASWVKLLDNINSQATYGL